jgi:hypothetical protein
MQNNTPTNFANSQQDLLGAAFQRAIALINQGKSRAQIETELKSIGLGQESASGVVNRAFQLRKKAHRDVAGRNMLFGALWCVGGTLFTVWSYQSASQGSGGGTYFIAWGAILFGGIQFLKGLGQLVANL